MYVMSMMSVMHIFVWMDGMKKRIKRMILVILQSVALSTDTRCRVSRTQHLDKGLHWEPRKDGIYVMFVMSVMHIFFVCLDGMKKRMKRMIFITCRVLHSAQTLFSECPDNTR